MFKGFRTMGLAAVSALLGVLATPQFQEAVPTEWLPYILIAVGVGTAVLRTVTDSPVFKRN